MQEYFVYFKFLQRSSGAKWPQGAAGDIVWYCRKYKNRLDGRFLLQERNPGIMPYSPELNYCPGCRSACPIDNPTCNMGELFKAQFERDKAEKAKRGDAVGKAENSALDFPVR